MYKTILQNEGIDDNKNNNLDDSENMSKNKNNFIITIKNILDFLSIQKEDKNKWVKYYNIETYKYYDIIINYIPNNKNILEIGSGGGVFYTKYKNILTKKNNKYTCIDIDKSSIKYSKNNCDYVNFYTRNILDFTKKELKKFDLLILVQSYIQIPKIEKVFKKYFNINSNGKIIMINTIFPNYLSYFITIFKSNILPKFFNNDCVKGKTLTINKIIKLKNYLNKKIKNINICKSLIGFNEYLTIIN